MMFQNEYRSLSESCKSYAVDLLDLCRSNEEVMAALHGGSDTRDLSRIRMAIRYEQKKVRCFLVGCLLDLLVFGFFAKKGDGVGER